jgi:hypothetical protein
MHRPGSNRQPPGAGVARPRVYDAVSSDDELPLYVLPSIDWRGIPSVRYQGNDALVVETELDWKVSERSKVGAFVGAGRLADGFHDLGAASSQVATGVGSLSVARRYGFVMGFDVARGPEETAFYVQAGSTW